MDELEIQGKKYISSRRASQLTGYAKDYVGQLARAGKISGTRVGRSWYVEEAALLSHIRSDTEGRSVEVVQEQKPTVSPLQLEPRRTISPATLKAMGYGIRSLPETWSPALYVTEHYDLIPRIEKNQGNKPRNDILTGTAIKIRIIDRRMPRLTPGASVEGIRRVEISAKARNIKAKRQPHSRVVSFGAVAAALSVSLFFSVGFLASLHVNATGPNGAYPANLEVGFRYVWDTLMKFPPVAMGVFSLESFFHIILASFFGFLDKGAAFILWIIHQIISLV